ncbi:hypothetical protein [Actinomyces glycerinitolerans]|uniref:Prokaryotic membrane lipoprotein lipid attachment site profile n=1 Tax=Actinomyces glycerinitolerans TaxID=1892869 RepID=A0A1M4RXB2_9ACTO|nr:hypothetical protein [Actinomyces glycerinitolerans]SHE24625.1 Hypothetical protein ACGLYG10_0832 [Actinomyces glycerinitolerans]
MRTPPPPTDTHRRRLTAGLLALLLTCTPLAACSSDSDDNPLNIPTYDPDAAASAEASESAAAAAASASAAASAEAAGIVTAESLSTDRYEVTSIPEDLDEQQTEVLKAFINYDQVTWNIWFTGTGIENAQAVATGDVLTTITENFENLNGKIDQGTVRIAVSEVAVVTFDTSQSTAEVRVCEDLSGITTYDASGQDISTNESHYRYDILVTMTSEDDTWKSSVEETLSTNECVV